MVIDDEDGDVIDLRLIFGGEDDATVVHVAGRLAVNGVRDLDGFGVADVVDLRNASRGSGGR